MRVCREIEEELKRLTERGQTIKKFSIAGYSLGGLVARYVVGLLESRGFFEKITPVVGHGVSTSSQHLLMLRQNFTTFATPHLGVHAPAQAWYTAIYNSLGARTVSLSGRQLFTIDNFESTGKPLLVLLAEPESVFMRGLERFKRRTVYANIINDRAVAYFTSYITQIDAYSNLDQISINYIPGYDKVIIPGAAPFTVVDDALRNVSLGDKLTKKGRQVLTTVPLVALFSFMAPVLIMGFLVNSGIQTFRSSRRIRLHEAGLAGIDLANYKIPLMLGNVKDAIEHKVSSHTETDNEPAEDKQPSVAADLSSEKPTIAPSFTPPNPEEESIPPLTLAEHQLRIIKNLDDLGLRKFGVHIHLTSHSHAAIIRRSTAGRYKEGIQVVKHWLDGEFLV